MNSNDIKWNKIKAIEKELPLNILDEESYLMWHGTRKGYNYEHFHKIATRKRWLLANKIYDIATENCTCFKFNPYGYSTTPISWKSNLEKMLEDLEWRSEAFTWNHTRGYNLIEEYREHYEYRNS